MKYTYALVTVTARVCISHANKADPTKIFESLEITKATVDGGKVTCIDVVDNLEVDIVED
jgi:hypothetical protein